MSSLSEEIKTSYGPEIARDKNQSPEDVFSCMAPVERFAEIARTMKKAGARLAAEWAVDETKQGKGFSVYACYNKGAEYVLVGAALSPADPSFPGLSKKFVAASRFERRMHSLMGVVPENLSDKRPWIKHEDWPQDVFPLRKSFDGCTKMARVKGDYDWVKADGEGVYEVPVGPVHAGIIEPGHFRFQAVGEDVINLEERLGYVHKGIEKRFEGLSWTEGARLAGRVSGDTTIAHATAYCRAVESISGCKTPARAHWLRALMLERERIANHLGDIGAICNDAAFAFFLYQFSRLREITLRNNKKLFGHRLLMDRVVPGGVSVDIDAGGIGMIRDETAYISKEFERLVTIYIDSPSLGNRVYGAGVLTPATAAEMGVVGVVARASGQRLDARIDMPYPPYDILAPNVPVIASGDVHARIMVRIEEIRESMRLMGLILDGLPEGAIKTPFNGPGPARMGFSVVEGWRGEIVYWVQSGLDGEINRCMVRDPSEVNWLALEQAVKGNLVPDFPLCNKSFNQSYSGNDL